MKSRDIRLFFKSTNACPASVESTARETANDVDEITNRTKTSTTVQNSPSSSTSEVVNSGEGGTKESEDHLDLGSLEKGPSQPRINFPRSVFGDRQRSFSAKHYDIYNWLEYSIKEDKIYCFVCRQFSTGNIRDQNEKFINSGFCNWKKLNKALKKHEKSSLHSQCSERFISYNHSLASGSVHEHLLTQYEEEVVQNRDYLMKLIDVILCLVRQGLPLRGHREDAASKNRGNFLEISEIFAKYDKNFSMHLEQHKSYCSPKIQNEIIDIIAQLTLQEIVKEVRTCGFFSLMVDEARCYKEEQLSVTIRYAKNLEVEERFLGFLNCSTSRDAQGLEKLLLEFLDKCGMTGIPIIAQSYDGATVMSGKNKGLQAKIKEIHPQAIFIHCLAHRLNLVVVDSCANVSLAAAFFNTLEALHVHFSQPGNHARLMKIRDTLGISKGCEMGSLSRTRWSCRYENCKAVLNNYNIIKEALEEEISQAQDKNSVEAIGILTCITKSDFVVSLFIFHSVLSVINVLSKYFQSKDATLGRASEIVISIIDSFEDSRHQFGDLWKEMKKFAEENEISLEPPRTSRKRKQPESVKDFLIDSTLGKGNFLELGTSTEPCEFWKINLFHQVIDNVVANFKRRFENLPLAQAVDSFIKLDFDHSQAFVDNYKDVMKIDTSSLQAEALIIKNILRKKGLEFDLESLKTNVSIDFTPNLYKMIQVSIGLPVSSAGCERSFSAMRRIKTWLRSTMVQQRFSNLALLNIENLLVKQHVTAQQVLDVFSKRNRMLKLV